jgi:transcriptional regulator with XRE-family HTH domain
VKYYRDEIFIKQFGKRLREIRLAQNVSQEELAGRTGFELSQIGRIERGIVNTSISHVSAIASALKISPLELFDFSQ